MTYCNGIVQLSVLHLERLSSVFADEAMVHVNWEEPNRLGYAGLGWSFTGVPATTSTPSEYITGVLNKAIRAVQ